MNTEDLICGALVADVRIVCLTTSIAPAARIFRCTGTAHLAGVDLTCACDCHVLPTIDPTAPGLPLPSVDPGPYLPVDEIDRWARNMAVGDDPVCGADMAVDERIRIRELDPSRIAVTRCHLRPHAGAMHIGQAVAEGNDLFARVEVTWVDAPPVDGGGQ